MLKVEIVMTYTFLFIRSTTFMKLKNICCQSDKKSERSYTLLGVLLEMFAII